MPLYKASVFKTQKICGNKIPKHSATTVCSCSVHVALLLHSICTTVLDYVHHWFARADLVWYLLQFALYFFAVCMLVIGFIGLVLMWMTIAEADLRNGDYGSLEDMLIHYALLAIFLVGIVGIYLYIPGLALDHFSGYVQQKIEERNVIICDKSNVSVINCPYHECCKQLHFLFPRLAFLFHHLVYMKGQQLAPMGDDRTKNQVRKQHLNAISSCTDPFRWMCHQFEILTWPERPTSGTSKLKKHHLQLLTMVPAEDTTTCGEEPTLCMPASVCRRRKPLATIWFYCQETGKISAHAYSHLTSRRGRTPSEEELKHHNDLEEPSTYQPLLMEDPWYLFKLTPTQRNSCSHLKVNHAQKETCRSCVEHFQCHFVMQEKELEALPFMTGNPGVRRVFGCYFLRGSHPMQLCTNTIPHPCQNSHDDPPKVPRELNQDMETSGTKPEYYEEIKQKTAASFNLINPRDLSKLKVLPCLVDSRTGGIEIFAVVDTGSNCSIVDAAIACQLPGYPEPTTDAIHTLKGELEFDVIQDISVRIGKQTDPHTPLNSWNGKFKILKNCPVPMILGLDILEKSRYQVTMNLKKPYLKMGDRKIHYSVNVGRQSMIHQKQKTSTIQNDAELVDHILQLECNRDRSESEVQGEISGTPITSPALMGATTIYDLLVVPVQLDQFATRAVIDTGCSKSIISSSLAAGLFQDDPTPTAEVISTLTGTVPLIGVKTLPITIGSQTIDHDFYIMYACPIPVILGLELLTQHKLAVTIDLFRSTLLIGTTNAEIPFLERFSIPQVPTKTLKLKPPRRLMGRVSPYLPIQECGFIKVMGKSETEKEYFLTRASLLPGSCQPATGEIVSFTPGIPPVAPLLATHVMVESKIQQPVAPITMETPERRNCTILHKTEMGPPEHLQVPRKKVRHGHNRRDVGTSPLHLAIGLLTLLNLLNVTQGITMPRPLICHRNQMKAIFSLPEMPPCNVMLTNADKMKDPPRKAIAQIYKINHVQYKGKAWHCSKIYQEVKSYSYFFADENLKKEKTEQWAVSPAECHQMKNWKKCEEGPLHPVGDIWKTNNKIDWSYPGGGVNCCYWKKFTAKNCALLTTVVFKVHREAMESPVGLVNHCKYEKGECQLADGSFLIWEVNKTQHCELIPWKVLTGKEYGTNWLSKDHNLALTFTKPTYATDCEGTRVKISDQGIPVTFGYGRGLGVKTDDLPDVDKAQVRRTREPETPSPQATIDTRRYTTPMTQIRPRTDPTPRQPRPAVRRRTPPPRRPTTPRPTPPPRRNPVRRPPKRQPPKQPKRKQPDRAPNRTPKRRTTPRPRVRSTTPRRWRPRTTPPPRRQPPIRRPRPPLRRPPLVPPKPRTPPPSRPRPRPPPTRPRPKITTPKPTTTTTTPTPTPTTPARTTPRRPQRPRPTPQTPKRKKNNNLFRPDNRTPKRPSGPPSNKLPDFQELPTTTTTTTTKPTTPDIMDQRMINILRGTGRVPREIPNGTPIRIERQVPNPGIATTDYVAASIQALEFRCRELTHFAYEHAIRSVCHQQRQLIAMIHAEAIANPTLVARFLLGRSDIVASSGGMAIEVHPCQELKEHEYRFLRRNTSCTREVPTLYMPPNLKPREMFMDPKTNVLTNTALSIDCSLVREVPIQIKNRTYIFHYDTGTPTAINRLRPIALFQFNTTDGDWFTQPLIFHQHVMYTWDEVQRHISLNDIMGTLSKHHEVFAILGLDMNEASDRAADQLAASITDRGTFGFLWGLRINPFQIWMFIVGISWTLELLYRFLIPPFIRNRMPSMDAYSVASGTYGMIQDRVSQWRGQRDGSGPVQPLNDDSREPFISPPSNPRPASRTSTTSPTIIEMDEFLTNSQRSDTITPRQQAISWYHPTEDTPPLRPPRKPKRTIHLNDPVPIQQPFIMGMLCAAATTLTWLPTVLITIAGHSFEGLVDTGCCYSVVHPRVISTLPIPSAVKFKTHIIARSINGRRSCYGTR